MVADAELINRLQEILRETDLDTATAGSVRKQLEKDFGVNLSDRKAFVRDQIDIFLQNLENERGAESENAEPIDKPEEDETAAIKEGEEVEGSDEEGDESPVKKEVKKRRGGFHTVCSLSPQLQKIVGASALPRTEVVKKMWVYIRENNLQDPKNKRNIICDESLHAVFRVKTINMFRMNKALTKHIWPLSSEDETGNQGDEEEEEEEEQQEEEVVKEEDEDDDDEPKEEVVKEEDEDDDDKQKEEDVKEEDEDDDSEEKEEVVVKEEDKDDDDDDDDEEEEEEEEEDSPKRSKNEGSSKVGNGVKKKGGGFAKLCSLSPQLQEVVGEPALARTEVVKRLWAYIREKNLQDPKNKRKIICNEELRALFRVKAIDMFQMNKVLSKHIWPLSEEDALAESGKTEVRQAKQAREKSEDEPKQKEKRQKTGVSGFLAPLPLSDALVKFLGTGENELSRSAAVKRMWEYIKQNDLQDPSNKKRILCDDKLKELFEVDSFDGFSVSKLLTAHFIKA